jgi:hypothetical protein
MRLSYPDAAPSVADRPPKNNPNSAHPPIVVWLSISKLLIRPPRRASSPVAASRHVLAQPCHTPSPATPRSIPGERTALDYCGRASSDAAIAATGPCRRARAWAASRHWRIAGGPHRYCIGELHAPLPNSTLASSSAMTSVYSSKQQGDIVLKAHVASVCHFKCFRYF